MPAVLMTLEDFRITYPEFSTADDALVQKFLDASAEEFSPETWGTYLFNGHGLLTAHRLAIAPMGQMARLDSDKAQTTYWLEYEKLRYAVTACIRIF